MRISESLNNKTRHIFVATMACLLAACGGSSGSGSGSSSTSSAPSVILTTPAKTTPIVTGVATNTALQAKFNQDMTATTLDASSFKVTCPVGSAIGGTITVTYDGTNRIATLQHANPFPENTICEATITTAAQNTSGVGMAENYVWSFMTGGASGGSGGMSDSGSGSGPDSTVPTVTAVGPSNNATLVCLTKSVSVTFSEAMDSSTINATTFSVTNPGLALMAGAVTYNAGSKTATFAITSSYVASTVYTVHVTVGAKDLSGNPMAAAFSSVFTTGTQACTTPTVVNLRSAATYGAFSGTGITNQGLLTVVNGDLGTTGVCTTVTGFHDSLNTYTTTGSNNGLVTGVINCAPPAPGTLATQALATQAQADAQLAYNALVAESPSITQGQELGGLTLPPGIYKSGAAFDITTGNLTLNGGGDADAVWVFQAPSALTVGLIATPRSVLLTNGAQAKNVFWQVGSSARIENLSTMVGTIIAFSSVTISTAGQTSTTSLTGRAIGLGAGVTMVNTIVTLP